MKRLPFIVPHYVQRSPNLATKYFLQEHVGEATFRTMYGEISGGIKVIELG